MRVAFDLTKDDLIAYNLHHQMRSPSMRRQRRMIAQVFILAGILISILFLRDSSLRTTRNAWVWILPLICVLAPLTFPRTTRRNIIKIVGRLIDEGKNRGLLGRREITITPADICTASELRSSTVRWKAVERIEETGDSLYIYISALEAIIIPRRAFPGDSDFAAFASGVRKHWEASEKTLNNA